MVRLKSPQEIEILAEGGAILSSILDTLTTKTKAGATGKELDALSQQLIAQANCTPAFLNYAPGGQVPFPAALCVSVNDALVHGLPNDVPFKEGDIVGLDLGLIHKGMYLDSARTVAVGAVSQEVQRLLDVTRESLALGIKAAQVGNTIGDIGYAVQHYVEGEGYSVIRQLVGHGVGYEVHEDPKVPNFGKPGSGLKLQEGLVIAIEPMVTKGDPLVGTAEDGWTVVTQTGAIAAHEEHTIAVTKAGPRILT